MNVINPIKKAAEVLSVMGATAVLLRIFGEAFGVSMNPDGLAARFSWPIMLLGVVVRTLLQKKEMASPQGMALDA